MPTSDYTPDLQDVGTLIAARTKDANGNELGTFTAATRPTQTQVEEQIAKAVNRLENRVGTDIDESLWDAAKEVVALDVASRVELSFFPDQVTVGRSPYQELKALHDQQETDLTTAIAAIAAHSGTEDDQSPGGLPHYGFPGLAPADADMFEIDPRNAAW